MKAKIRIEDLEGTNGRIVAVLVNDECIGTCMTDGTLTPYECYQSVKNNWEIDILEGLEDERIINSYNY